MPDIYCTSGCESKNVLVKIDLLTYWRTYGIMPACGNAEVFEKYTSCSPVPEQQPASEFRPEVPDY
jgi:hypothetical protein